jgi:dTDP-glucose 4,6-dehydratase
MLAMQVDGCRRYNLGNGAGVLMRELAEEIVEAVGSRSPLIDGGERPGDPTRLVASIDRVRRELGWEPRISRAEGIKRTVEFFAARAGS